MTRSREEILELLVRWEEAKAQGQDPAPEELCRDCPDRLDEFRRQLVKLGLVDWLNQPLEVTTTPKDGQADTILPETGLPRTLADRYRLDVLIGVGGFGRVYKGFDTWLDRPVAVKVPKVDRPVGAEEVDQCRIEAKKVARLRHPNIVPVHDVGKDGGSCFIVSEWIEGIDLQSRIKDERLSYRQTAHVIAEVADALGHAHAQGYVHRDIKPGNILLDGSGRAYLTDFGIAVVEEELLKDVGAAGTLAYMAPEQLDSTLGRADHRADIYALGVVFFELLTGRRPFQASSPIELREQIVAGDVPPPRSIETGVPETLERFCLRCLARHPENRYHEADPLAADLRAFLAS
ncbi:MAG: serine/threonine-protein kinase [Isosphaeraceae bacterium]|nr:serine/threonine-protein kinase [Isosphaeraceae bacterium]